MVVCMYVCMVVCMYVCMYVVFMFIFLYIFIHVHGGSGKQMRAYKTHEKPSSISPSLPPSPSLTPPR